MIQYDQGRGKADNPYRHLDTLIILDIIKTESDDCFITHRTKKIEVMFLLPH